MSGGTRHLGIDTSQEKLDLELLESPPLYVGKTEQPGPVRKTGPGG